MLSFVRTVLMRGTAAMGRSYGELDVLFENRVSAWRFSRTKVDRASLPALLGLLLSHLTHPPAEFGLPDGAAAAADEKASASHDSK